MCINTIVYSLLSMLTVLGSNVYDAGKVKEGTSILHVFRIVNTGKDTIQINEIRRTCGCTTVIGGKKELAPSDTLPLTVKVNTYGYRGEIEKSVYVFYSMKDNKQKYLKLKIKAFVFKNSESPGEVFYKIRLSAIFDLRDKKSYKECHIIGSENITEDSLVSFLKTGRLHLDKMAYLYLVVTDSIQGEDIVKTLRKMGYEHTFYIEGGINRWIKELGKSSLLCSK